MKKKVIAGLLTLCMCLSLTACGKKQEEVVDTTPVYEEIAMKGISMEPQFKANDTLQINKNFQDIKRFDVIAYKRSSSDDYNYVHRVYGLPGETIKILDGTISINGKTIEDPYANGEMDKSSNLTFTLKENEYFVLGDARAASKDSRNAGADKTAIAVSRSQIEGVVTAYKSQGAANWMDING